MEDLQLSDNETLQSPSKVDNMICPCHLVRLENRQSSNGWNYVKCPKQPCLLFCDKDQAPEYMSEVYKNVHPDICDRWERLTCFCGQLPTLRQSHSAKNPNRLYLNCTSIAPHRCRFFRWADQPIEPNNPKDPLSVRQWLTEELNNSADPPPTTPEDDNEGLKRMCRMATIFQSPGFQNPAPPPPKYSDSVQNWQQRLETVEYDKLEDLRNWYNRTGLF